MGETQKIFKLLPPPSTEFGDKPHNTLETATFYAWSKTQCIENYYTFNQKGEILILNQNRYKLPICVDFCSFLTKIIMMKRIYTSAYAHSLLVLIELEKFYYCSKSSKMALIDLGGGSRTKISFTCLYTWMVHMDGSPFFTFSKLVFKWQI